MGNEVVPEKKETRASNAILKIAGVIAALAVLVGAATNFVDSLKPLRAELIELISSSNESYDPVVKPNSGETEPSQSSGDWETVLDVSRVAEGYEVGVSKYASTDAGKYKLVVHLDNLTDNSASFRITGEGPFVVSSTLSVGKEFDFQYKGEKMRLVVVSIRKPAWYRRLAMYFKIERYK